MRLIDADALKKYLRDYKWEFAMGSDFTKAMEMIDAQPTAYDIEKVVKQLEELEDKDTREIYLTHHIVCEEAIDIVRKGGVE